MRSGRDSALRLIVFGAGIAMAVAGVVITLETRASAFDPGIHERLTEEVLRSQGFDEDSADEVGDSNYWTDTFEATSEDAHADNNRLGAASTRLQTKLQLIGDALDACRRRDALDALGEALHTVQDVFSHSNSVDNGRPVSLLNMVDGTAACNAASNFAPGGLVTGHFSALGWLLGQAARPPNPRGQCLGTPPNACCHYDLNKDNGGVPNGGRHDAARAAARLGTLDYLASVENDIRARFAGDRATQLLKILKRKQRTVMFVIDDTGSMSDDIAGVRSAVNSFLNQVVAGDEAPTLGLVSFKDDVSNRGLSCNIDALRAQINALFASGGGDCPEASNAALLSAIRTFPLGRSDIQLSEGRVLLATDASAGDAALGPTVQAEAARRGISIDAILTGDCAPEDSFAGASAFAAEAAGVTALATDPLTSRSARTLLRALTEQTGGVLFNVSRVEVDDVVPTLLEMSAPESSILLTRRVEPTLGSVTVDVDVEDSLEGRITFMVTSSTAAGLPSVSIRRPGGALVQPGDPDVTRRALSSVVSFLIQSPVSGRWQVVLQGGGRAVVRAFGPSAFRFNGLRLLVPGVTPARPEADLAPLDGQPVVGTTIVAEIRFTEAPTDASLSMRRADGGLIQALPLSPLEGGRHMRATITVPGESFLLELTGRSPSGGDFVRQFPVMVVPRSVGIRATPPVSAARAGTDAPVEVTISNASPSLATYTVTAAPTLPWPITLPPAVSVTAGGSATVAVVIHVPAGATEGMRNDVTLHVQDAAIATDRNSTSVAVVVAPPNEPPVCGAATPSVDRLWPANHAFVDVGVQNITDPDGDPVTISITGITQDEPVDGNGSGDTVPDGRGVGSSVAAVRAERSGNGDGRVYAVGFMASDGKGGQCTGTVSVGVPHSVKGSAIDSGQTYDSTSVRR